MISIEHILNAQKLNAELLYAFNLKAFESLEKLVAPPGFTVATCSAARSLINDFGAGTNDGSSSTAGFTGAGAESQSAAAPARRKIDVPRNASGSVGQQPSYSHLCHH